QAQQPQPQVTQRQHQRFSWQAPVETETTPRRLPQYQEVQHQPQQPVVNTNIALQHDRGFSYAPTSTEHNGSAYYTSSSDDPTLPSSPVFTPIDDRPQSMFNMLNTPARRQSQQAYAPLSHPHDEETLLSPSSPEAQTLPFMLVESVVGGQDQTTSQAQQPAPAPQSPVQQSRHARQMSNLAPLNTNLSQPVMPAIPQSPRSGTEHQTSPGALPYKTPISPISSAPIRKDTPNSSYNSHTRHQTHAAEPYSPHNFSSHNLATPHAIFSPDAAHGPNGLDFSLHQPGQIRHPNMDDQSSRAWKNGLCACTPDVSTCLTGLFCPCILSGRTAYRLSQKSKKADPTDMLGHSSTNGHCIAMSLACGVGLGWVFPMVQRTRIRHLYKLEGSCGDDLVKGCCCCCCVAVQNEREVSGREESANRWAGPASRDVYTRSGGMEYRPQ
ncbi:PLAC8-domain-containing protein, partial [Macroventuria anomochaeta]